MTPSTPQGQEALAPLLAMFEPLIKTVVAQAVEETLRQREADQAKLGDDRVWHRESEAGAMCGLPPHRLRDCRRRGEIVGSRIGKTIGYERAELLRFIRSQRLDP